MILQCPCQVKLFRDWFGGWSDDQKNYLTLRLKDVDEEFFSKYEEYLQNPHPEKKKDYFEPGVPGNCARRDSPFHQLKVTQISSWLSAEIIGELGPCRDGKEMIDF